MILVQYQHSSKTEPKKRGCFRSNLLQKGIGLNRPSNGPTFLPLRSGIKLLLFFYTPLKGVFFMNAFEKTKKESAQLRKPFLF